MDAAQLGAVDIASIVPGLLGGVFCGAGAAHALIGIGEGVGGLVGQFAAVTAAEPELAAALTPGGPAVGALQNGEGAEAPACKVFFGGHRVTPLRKWDVPPPEGWDQ